MIYITKTFNIVMIFTKLLTYEVKQIYDPVKVSKLKYIPQSLLIVFLLYEGFAKIGYVWNDIIMQVFELLMLSLLILNSCLILIIPGIVIDFIHLKLTKIVDNLIIDGLDDEYTYSLIEKHNNRWARFYYNWFNVPELVIISAFYIDLAFITNLHEYTLLNAIRTHTLWYPSFYIICIIIFLFSFVFNMTYYIKLLNNLNNIQQELLQQNEYINDINKKLLLINELNNFKKQLYKERDAYYVEYDNLLKTFIKMSETLNDYYMILPFNLFICVAILLYFNMFITIFVCICIIIYNNKN